MLLLTQTQVAQMLLAELPDARLPLMWTAQQYVVPKLSWYPGFRTRLTNFYAQLGLKSSDAAGKPICDVFTKAMQCLAAADVVATRDAWATGLDTDVALFQMRVLLPPGEEFLGIISPLGGGHATGLAIFQDDADRCDNQPRVFHIEPQTPWYAPIGKSLARGLLVEQIED